MLYSYVGRLRFTYEKNFNAFMHIHARCEYVCIKCERWV